jgi:dihydroxyacetone kinase-like predicted kinase
LLPFRRAKPISNLFKEMGVSEIISGGQTMNPSAQDFVEAFKNANADNIIVFPNNGNVILTAQQAAKTLNGQQDYHHGIEIAGRGL